MTTATSLHIARPRLAHLFSRYPVVSHTFVDNEMLALQERGWDVVVLSLSPPKDDFRHARLSQFAGPTLYAPPPAFQKKLQPSASLLKELRSAYGEALEPEKCLRNATSLAPLVQALGIGHLHVHFANRATYAALIIKRLLHVPFSFTPQAADFLVDLNAPDLLRGFCKEASFIVAPCDYASERLAELCPESSSKLVRIYNGIDPKPYLPASPARIPKPLRLVSVGRLLEFKGFHHAIEAVSIARREGVEAILHIQGDGPWRKRLQDKAASLAVADLVVFEGTVGIEAMRQRFAESDAFVLACTVDERGASDMLPTVITEAMLCGLPVVSCPVAGVPEQVVDGQTGILVPSASPRELAAALVRLATEPCLARTLGEAGKKRAMQLFIQDSTLPLLEAKFAESKPILSARPIPDTFSLYDIPSHPSSKILSKLWKNDAQEGRGILIAGAGQADSPLPTLPSDVLALHLPDGMALEMEWQSLHLMRDQLEAAVQAPEYTKDFSTEARLLFARRALWVARQLPRLSAHWQLEPRDAPSLLTSQLIKAIA